MYCDIIPQIAIAMTDLTTRKDRGVKISCTSLMLSSNYAKLYKVP